MASLKQGYVVPCEKQSGMKCYSKAMAFIIVFTFFRPCNSSFSDNLRISIISKSNSCPPTEKILVTMRLRYTSMPWLLGISSIICHMDWQLYSMLLTGACSSNSLTFTLSSLRRFRKYMAYIQGVSV